MDLNRISDSTSLRFINAVYFTGTAISILGCAIRREGYTTTTLNEATYFLLALVATIALSTIYIVLRLFIEHEQQPRLISRTLKPR